MTRVLKLGLAALLLAGCATPGDHASLVGFVAVSDGRLAYELRGSGPTVVLVHGGLVDRRLWDAQVEVLAPYYRVLRYDLRGFGESSSPAGAFSHVEDLAALLDQLRVESATVVGLSLGGSIATDFALEHPDRVDALVLVGAALRGFAYQPASLWRKIYLLARTDSAGAIDLMMNSTSIAPAAGAGRRLMRRMLEENVGGWVGGNARLVRWPEPTTIQRLEAIEVPTFVLVGERDGADLRKIADILAARIAGAARSVSVLPDASHHANLDNPELFNLLLREFLEGVEGAAAN